MATRDEFALDHPDLKVTRFLVPYFEMGSYTPPPEEYRQLESHRIHEQLAKLLADGRPDLILIGRESFAWHVPDMAKSNSIPCMLRAAGSLTHGILNRSYPDILAGRLLDQYRKVDMLITPAAFLADGLRQLGFGNVGVIPNAVDLDDFAPRPKDPSLLQSLAIRRDQTVVMHLSNLKTLKRPLDVVSSAAQALQHNSNLVYVVVGDGPLRRAMEDSCREAHITKYVRFVGWVDYPGIPAYINLADIVVMPSEAEGQARVYLETQACGRVLLASDIPAARQVVIDGVSGLLFRRGDVDDLTAKTLRAAADAELRARIGRYAREHVKTHGLADAVAAYDAVITDLLHPPGRPGRTPGSLRADEARAAH